MILILGVTASGKGKLAFELAKQLKAQIISIDSMKVYRRMDIGTAKPSLERRRQIRHHLIDVVEPSEAFSVDKFLELTDQAIQQIKSQNQAVVAVGGTAMYIKALLYGIFEGPGTNPDIRAELNQQIEKFGLHTLYEKLQKIDPEAADRIHPNDKKRIIRALEVFQLTGKTISQLQRQWQQDSPSDRLKDWTIIGLRRPKQIESSRINQRVKRMIELGLVDEVKSLLAEPKPLSQQAACAIGYAEIIEYLNGSERIPTLEKAIEKIKINTRRLAKAQRTWFKTFRNINWLDISEQDTLEDITQKALQIIEQNPTS